MRDHDDLRFRVDIEVILYVAQALGGLLKSGVEVIDDFDRVVCARGVGKRYRRNRNKGEQRTIYCRYQAHGILQSGNGGFVAAFVTLVIDPGDDHFFARLAA